eukprot:gnl/TRDRNA2_/TRDRNA2_99348_c1_seq1.p1 gnl/TRDRNA2_/TRDRNA2_99348_c1~~gnl/TRDRNA2_/TRDRNA2_99348_c1_seq1.p1  ORF type:complete len:446 (+),score=47.81 gnl/TRDRNA2_/TRDRNA2_99348_c1_seq1:85-1338(+)
MLHHHLVLHTLRTYLIDAFGSKSDIFLRVDDADASGVSDAEMRALLSHLEPVAYKVVRKLPPNDVSLQCSPAPGSNAPECGNSGCSPKDAGRFSHELRSLQECWQMTAKHEEAMQFRYDFVIRVRPSAVFYLPVRPFCFWSLSTTVRVESMGYWDGNWAVFSVAGTRFPKPPIGRGINMLAFHLPDGSPQPQYRLTKTFDTWQSPSGENRLVKVLEGLPNRTLLLIAVKDEAARYLTARGRRALQKVGATKKIAQLNSHDSYALITVVGKKKPLAEMLTKMRRGPAVAEAVLPGSSRVFKMGDWASVMGREAAEQQALRASKALDSLEACINKTASNPFPALWDKVKVPVIEAAPEEDPVMIPVINVGAPWSPKVCGKYFRPKLGDRAFCKRITKRNSLNRPLREQVTTMHHVYPGS